MNQTSLRRLAPLLIAASASSSRNCRQGQPPTIPHPVRAAMPAWPVTRRLAGAPRSPPTMWAAPTTSAGRATRSLDRLSADGAESTSAVRPLATQGHAPPTAEPPTPEPAPRQPLRPRPLRPPWRSNSHALEGRENCLECHPSARSPVPGGGRPAGLSPTPGRA